MQILLLPGDGIGPEITAATETVLAALDARHRLGLVLERAEIGLASLGRRGSTLPDDVLDRVREADGIVLGPLDTAVYPPKEEGGINPSAALRLGLDLFANIRPSRTWKGLPAPARAMDLVIVRENTEGFYADRTMFAGSGEFMPTPDLALAVRKITRAGAARVGRVACEIAMARSKRLTIVHKGNVLKMSDGLFIAAIEGVLGDFPAIAVDDFHVDAMASLLVRSPERFDVVVTSNMFGDILSNLAAELSGGLGLGGSLNAGHDRAVAQAAHGCAPDIAGKNVANPSALMLSAGMLLDWLGGRHGRAEMKAAARSLEAAIAAQFADGSGLTPDLGGRLGTDAFGAAVAARIAGTRAVPA